MYPQFLGATIYNRWGNDLRLTSSKIPKMKSFTPCGTKSVSQKIHNQKVAVNLDQLYILLDLREVIQVGRKTKKT